jgi:hypothetical protein
VGRLTLSIGCVSGLKEVRFVRSSSYGWVRFDRCSPFNVRCSIVRLKGNYKYKSGTRKKLETLTKVEEVVTS